MENNSLLLKKFVEEIEQLPSQPCDKPYNLDGYSDIDKAILQDIDQNRNHSWIKEVYNRRKNDMDNIADINLLILTSLFNRIVMQKL